MKTLKDLDLEQFKQDDKITVVKMSEFGFPLVLNLKIDKLYLKDYAQYKDCLYIQGKLSRKRKSRVYMIRPTDEVVIYNGVIDVDYFNTFKTVTKEDNVTTENWGMCFSRGTLEKFTNIDKNPIFKMIKEN